MQDLEGFLTSLAALHNLKELDLRRGQYLVDSRRCEGGEGAGVPFMPDVCSEGREYEGLPCMPDVGFIAGIFRVLSARALPSRHHYHLEILSLKDDDSTVTLER